jgi:PhnB protein
MVRAIPEGYHAVTTYLHVARVSNLVDFLKQAFDGVELERVIMPDGRIEHVEVRIGDSIVMLSDASDKYPAMPSWVYLYVNDSDEVYRKAVQAGATSLMAPADVHYGEHVGGV